MCNPRFLPLKIGETRILLILFGGCKAVGQEIERHDPYTKRWAAAHTNGGEVEQKRREVWLGKLDLGRGGLTIPQSLMRKICGVKVGKEKADCKTGLPTENRRVIHKRLSTQEQFQEAFG